MTDPPPRTFETVLLTGAAGFIGSHTADRLLAEGYDVIGVDNFDPYYAPALKRANLAGALASPRYRFVELDILDREALARLPAFDAVVHMASKAGVRPSIDDSRAYQEVNILGTQHLLDLAVARGVKQFVFSSSSSVYGVSAAVPWVESDAQVQPISPYASSKLSTELLGSAYAHLHGLRFVALRYFTAFGPRQRPDLAIRKFVECIRAGRPVDRYGSGDTARDYTYVDDVVSATVAALDYDATGFERINVGAGRQTSLNELIAAIEGAVGRSARINALPQQPGDVPQTYANIDKARRLLGYEPKVGLREGIQRYLAWLDGG